MAANTVRAPVAHSATWLASNFHRVREWHSRFWATRLPRLRLMQDISRHRSMIGRLLDLGYMYLARYM